MAYTTINKSSDYFITKLYSGDGGTQNITGLSFQPDFTWLKCRSGGFNHRLFDAVRGAGKNIQSNATSLEQTIDEGVTAFNSDGFSVKQGGGLEYNNSSHTYVSWNWKANGAGSTNTDGSINSVVSANTTAGFSIVKYTGTGSDATIGHGLGVAPKMILVKAITGTAHDWVVYHATRGNNKAIALNLSNNEYTATGWQTTSPTNSVFYIKGSANSVAGSMDFIAYCFADIPGYQKCGGYTGNGSADKGTFAYTGFKPAMVFFKRTTGGSANWQMWDHKRDPYNPVEKALHPDISNTPSADQDIDFLSNGFKIRSNQNHLNASGVTFIYYAVAEAPLVGSNNIPCTAR